MKEPNLKQTKQNYYLNWATVWGTSSIAISKNLRSLYSWEHEADWDATEVCIFTAN